MDEQKVVVGGGDLWLHCPSWMLEGRGSSGLGSGRSVVFCVEVGSVRTLCPVSSEG